VFCKGCENASRHLVNSGLRETSAAIVSS
jgi:hypothetical protein